MIILKTVYFRQKTLGGEPEISNKKVVSPMEFTAGDDGVIDLSKQLRCISHLMATIRNRETDHTNFAIHAKRSAMNLYTFLHRQLYCGVD